MHLLYLDESGTDGGNYFVLAGLSVFERDTYFFNRDFDALQESAFPNLDDPIELHAAEIRARSKPPWDRLTFDQASELLDRAYSIIVGGRCVLFGVAINRQALRPEDSDEYSFAFESIVRRFDGYLSRLYRENNDRQKGLVVVAESSFRQRIEVLAKELLRSGTRWGELFDIAEIPLFTMARNSRLLQAADFCANAVKGRYEHGYTRQFDRLMPKFDCDTVTGQLHGLYHYTPDHTSCFCPACLSRRQAGT
jgi:hypothetical protein